MNTPETGKECKAFAGAMPDLLFDPARASAAAQAHLAACLACQRELSQLQRTMQALEGWHTPEPSPFWNARMGARLREEQAAPARGWSGFSEKLRTRLWLSNHKLNPAGVAAFGLLLAIGGGTWLNLATQPAPSAQASNTVRDLQSLNENAQVFQELSALDAPDSGSQSTSE